MKLADMRKLSTPELRAKLTETREELFKLRFQHAIAQLDDTSRLTTTRRIVAKMETVLRERELAEQREN